MMSLSNHRKIRRVPSLVLAEEKEKENDYYPKVVSIGPHHYGKPELAVVEAFKPKAVELFVGGPEEVDIFYHKVLDFIGEVRNYYEEKAVAKFSDEALAQMMLRDASLIILNMEFHIYIQPKLVDLEDPSESEVAALEDRELALPKLDTVVEHLGLFTLGLMFIDFMLVENQIPLCVIELLIKLRHGEGKHQEFIYTFVNLFILGENQRRPRLPQPPLHLLGFAHMVLTWGAETISPQFRHLNHDPVNWAQRIAHSFRRVMDLKAKGIHFRPSATRSLMDVEFKPGFFRATLQLPTWIVTPNTKPFLKNLIAYELLMDEYGGMVGSYIDLMQSLIERPEDVKEVRERKILYTLGRSDKEVLKMFKNIKLYGSSDLLTFFDAREEIQAHYNSKIKTWIAELIHAHFRTPWTAIAFLAAAVLIALSAAQLHYTLHPPHKTPTSS